MKTPEEVFIEELKELDGIRETEPNRGVEHLWHEVFGGDFLEMLDRKGPGDPWCVVAALYAKKKAEQKTGKKSWIHLSASVIQVWNRTPVEARMKVPIPGCLMLWLRKSNLQAGHMEGVISRMGIDGYVETIGGNTRGVSTVSRDGDGAHKGRRRVASFPSADLQVLGFLRIWKPT